MAKIGLNAVWRIGRKATTGIGSIIDVTSRQKEVRLG